MKMRLISSAIIYAVITFLKTSCAAPPRSNGIGQPGHRSCYFASWALYRDEEVKYAIKDVPGDLCTHLVYGGYAVISNRTWELTPLEPWYEVTSNAHRKLLTLREKYPHLKSVISVGGWGDESVLPQMLSVKEHRDAFIQSIVKFLKEFRLDGLDIDWEFPAEGEAEGTPSVHIKNFLTLLREIRATFDAEGKGWELTTAVTISQEIMNEGRHMLEICNLVDAVTSEANGLRGYWDAYGDSGTNSVGLTCHYF